VTIRIADGMVKGFSVVEDMRICLTLSVVL
jgi:hypothetical protein